MALTPRQRYTTVVPGTLFRCKQGRYHRRGKRGTRSERRREAGTHVSKRPNRRHLGDDVGGGAMGLLPPARRNLGTTQAGRKNTERKEIHRLRKAEGRGEKKRSAIMPMPPTIGMTGTTQTKHALNGKKKLERDKEKTSKPDRDQTTYQVLHYCNAVPMAK